MFLVPEWQAHAACAGSDPKIFFPVAGHANLAKKAKRICAGCSVSDECHDYAQDLMMKYGVWGGTTEKERRQIRRGAAVLAGRPNP